MLELNPGETYTVTLGVTNTSKKAGTPVAATLGVGISAAVADIYTLIAPQIEQVSFGAGETREVPFSMIVPPDAKGEGNISAWVENPAGNVLASGQESVIVTSAGLSILGGDIIILQVGGKALKNISGLTAELVEPMVINNMRDLKVPVKFRNVGMDVRPGELGVTNYVGFESSIHAPTLAGEIIEYDCRWSWGYYECQRRDCEKPRQAYNGYSATRMGYEGVTNLVTIQVWGYWCQGMYDLHIRCGPVPWDMPWIWGASETFVIKNALQCVNNGRWDDDENIYRTW